MNILHSLVLFLGIVPQSPAVLSDSVATLEVQHFYDDEGRLIFTQLIGWNENETVRFWRMAKTESHRPIRDWQNGGYRVTFEDGDKMRTIASATFRETWAQHDRELENRSVLPPEQRRALRKE
jgi:hypothetical protein